MKYYVKTNTIFGEKINKYNTIKEALDFIRLCMLNEVDCKVECK